jgi:hypothetical protein
MEVSNDNGVTWELYDWTSEAVHIFSSTGYQVRVKISLTGTGISSSYIIGAMTPAPTVTLYSKAALYSIGRASEVTDISNYKIKAL